MKLHFAESSSVIHIRQGFKSPAHSESPLKWTLIRLSRACFQTSPSDLAPPKSGLKRGTLTKFSPLFKAGALVRSWGGSRVFKTHPSPLKRTLAISPEINFRAGFGGLLRMAQEVR
jgi:hypothetical protein